MPDNGTIMNEKNIGDAAEPFQGFTFVRANRFIAQVAAGGDDRKAEFGQQQVMQRRVRQHDAEMGIAGSHGICDLRFAICDFSEQDDGRFG